jgi:hypothetical protein
MTTTPLRGRLAAALVLCLGLAACGKPEPFLQPAERHAAVGKTRTELVARFGQPHETYVEDDKTYLTYILSLNTPIGYYNASTKSYHVTGYMQQYCRVTFLLIGERVVQDFAVGENCG